MSIVDQITFDNIHWNDSPISKIEFDFMQNNFVLNFCEFGTRINYQLTCQNSIIEKVILDGNIDFTDIEISNVEFEQDGHFRISLYSPENGTLDIILISDTHQLQKIEE